ncbi:MAG: outer membrane beta-barrel protein [Sphingomonadales bacterium]|jgi:outer membrane immunogenic protein
MKFNVALAVAAMALSTSAQAAKTSLWAEARTGVDSAGEAGDRNTGLLYGVAAGFDEKVTDQGFFGLAAGIAGSTIEDCSAGFCGKAGRDLEVLFRAGAYAGARTKVVLFGGYANGRYQARIANVTYGFNDDGWRIGTGVERTISGNIYGKIEYRYTDYGKAKVNGTVIQAGDRHQGSISVGIRF